MKWRQNIGCLNDGTRKSSYGDVIADGIFGEPAGEMAAGDQINGGGDVVYVGDAKDGITIDELSEILFTFCAHGA